MKKPTNTALLLGLLVLLAAAFGLGRWMAPAAVPNEATTTQETVSAEPTVWTCAMHPQVRLPEPGKCPICGMELIPADDAGGAGLGPRDLKLSEEAAALADIQTAKVERRSVAHEVRMVGKVAYDETRVATITSWVPGRLDRLFVDYTGVAVRKGDHLAEIYSPTLYSAQQELLQAIATAQRLGPDALDVLKTASESTIKSSREKLRLYGMTPAQIQALEERGTPDEHVTVYAPSGGIVIHKMALEGMYVKEGSEIYTIADLSKVWVFLDAYESDLPWLRYGQDVTFEVEALPGETLHGRVAFIAPTLDEKTRTVKVRLNVENADGRLKPGMFVSATAAAVLSSSGKVVDSNLAGKWMCPMHPEVIADGPEDCPECGMALQPVEDLGFAPESSGEELLVIPESAPLLTGKRAVVYVKLPYTTEPTFQGREVALGPRAGDWYVVEDGLEEGEEVVVKGNFKLDSELQIRAQPSMMNPSGGGPASGHHHGGMDGMDRSEEMRAVPRTPEHTAEEASALAAALTEVLPAYLEAQRLLVEDTDPAEAADALLAAVEGAGELSDDLAEAARTLADAPDLEARRTAFVAVSHALISLADGLGDAWDFPTALGVFHCPMAADGAGADWIAPKGPTRNPYFGTDMPGCGSMTRLVGEER